MTTRQDKQIFWSDVIGTIYLECPLFGLAFTKNKPWKRHVVC